MSQQGATLQNYNNELVKCIEDLREKREEVNRSIAKDEEEKGAARSATRPSDSPRAHYAPLSMTVVLPPRATHPRSQDSKRPADPDRAAGAHQR